MAMDRRHNLLFIGARNPKVLVVMDASNGKIIAGPFPIGDHVDTSVFDPETGLIALSTRDGAIHIFHEDSPAKFTPVETVKTEFGAKTMALDPKTHNLYVDHLGLHPAFRRQRPAQADSRNLPRPDLRPLSAAPAARSYSPVFPSHAV